VQDEINRYITAKETELTEALKPEWQRRLESWQNTTELMRRAYDSLMDGIVTKGEDAFTEWVTTGSTKTSNLVDFIKAELARLAYRKYVSGALNSALDWVLNAATGGSDLTVDPNGAGIPADIDVPPSERRAAGGGVRAGRMVEINETRGPGEIFSAGGRQYLLAAQGGWVSPLRSAGGTGQAGGAPNVVNITYNVPSGESPASYAAALERNNQRLKAEIAHDAMRPGRMLNRALGG
jgi:hypothetical protein